jgi:DNA-binding NtrC family response regulator
VSRYHIELSRGQGGIVVKDLGSLNGTFIGGLRVMEAIVPAGTRLRLGESELVVEDGETFSDKEETAAEIPEIVSLSESMDRVKRSISRLAKTEVTVLVQGETGTGKELVARALHDHGPRASKPFVTVDCGSMPATLVASELFGHERGAFTSADRSRIGSFEEANGGTVLLDEIGELPLQVQPVLLGALERKRFRRVGGARDIDVDVRVVAATNRDLREEVNRGTFRADLYYRLAAARIILPPLRERLEDIEVLVRHFVTLVQGTDDPLPFSAGTLSSLATQPWRGNVRELRNVVETALAMGGLTLDAKTRPDGVPTVGVSSSYREAKAEALEQFEKTYLGALIESCEGNASEAARVARMDRSHLLTLLRKHGLR